MQLNSHCMQEGAYRSPQCVDRVSVCLCVFLSLFFIGAAGSCLSTT